MIQFTWLMISCSLFLCVESRNWTIFAPPWSAILNVDKKQTTGLLPTLFNGTLDPSGDSFDLEPVLDWFEKIADQWDTLNDTDVARGTVRCFKNLSFTDPDALCLYHSTPTILSTLHAESSSSNPVVMTVPLFQLHPRLLVRCENKRCGPVKIPPTVVKATYFMRAFHSSIWSLILLYILVAGPLLCMFEITHPFRWGFQNRVKRYEGCFTLIESYTFVVLAMFLQPYKKFPKSWAGITLALFWYAFALICVIAYAAGSMRQLFQPLEQIEIAQQVIVSSHDPIACEKNHLWCNSLLFNSAVNLTVEPIEFKRDIWGSIQFTTDWIENGSRAIVVDHVTANKLLLESDRKDTNMTWQWTSARLDCSQSSLESAFNLPPIEVGFVTINPSAAFMLNRYDLQVTLSGEKQKLINQWLGFPPHSLCFRSELTNGDVPIRLVQMNGPLLFMICGAILAVITHLAEFIYLTFIKTDSSIECAPKEGWENLT